MSTYERDRTAYLAGYLKACRDRGLVGTALTAQVPAAAAGAERYARAEDWCTDAGAVRGPAGTLRQRLCRYLRGEAQRVRARLAAPPVTREWWA